MIVRRSSHIARKPATSVCPCLLPGLSHTREEKSRREEEGKQAQADRDSLIRQSQESRQDAHAAALIDLQSLVVTGLLELNSVMSSLSVAQRGCRLACTHRLPAARHCPVAAHSACAPFKALREREGREAMWLVIIYRLSPSAYLPAATIAVDGGWWSSVE